MELFLGIIVVLAALLLAYVAVRVRHRRVAGLERRRILGMWQALHTVRDRSMKVLHADAVLHQALQSAGYDGTTGDMLRRAGPRLSDKNAVWKAHKLRNTIAHEPGTDVSAAQAKTALRAFKSAIDDLLYGST